MIRDFPEETPTVLDPQLWDEGAHAWIVGEKSGLLVAVIPFMFTAGIVIGRLTAFSYYEDRWCYHTAEAAYTAALAWTGDWPGTEPSGWHRHPISGRRVHPDGTTEVRL